MKYFKELTTRTHDPTKRNAVIMGRKTWESIPEKFRPLPGRLNVILSRKADEIGIHKDDSVHVVHSLDAALSLLSSTEFAETVETVFVIGGGQIYRESMDSPSLAAIHLTLVESDVECDTFFPAVNENTFKLWAATSPKRDSPAGPRYSFLLYTRANVKTQEGSDPITTGDLPPATQPRHEEQQYLDLINEVMNHGSFRGDRTGTGTFSKFGATMRFNLRHYFPLLTTKRVFWRGTYPAVSANGCIPRFIPLASLVSKFQYGPA